MMNRGVGILLLLGIAVRAACGDVWLPGVSQGNVSNGQLDELSGLAASRLNRGVLWTHNDSGDSARVFALDTTGRLLGTYSFPSAIAIDWEDIAVGPGPVAGVNYIFVGDIGDNLAIRPSIRIYRAPEPVVVLSQVAAPVTASLAGISAITLTYPSGPSAPTTKDAETLLVDPVLGDLYIVTKGTGIAQVYRATAAQLNTQSSITLTPVVAVNLGGASRRLTAGDISATGDQILLRGLDFILRYPRAHGQPIQAALSIPGLAMPVASEPQGEAIAFDRRGWGYFTVSESSTPPLFSFALACPADFNRSGDISVQDIFDFLSAWNTRSPACDFGDDGDITVQDIFDFLSAWNDGC
jgi:hypothetical protein